VETFTFTIVLPPAPGARDVFETLSGQMARYIGLGPEEAGQAGGVLNRLVAERLAAGVPVSVTFVRPHQHAPVRVEIAGAGPALTLSWSARNGG
jgi:hypothetical protein